VLLAETHPAKTNNSAKKKHIHFSNSAIHNPQFVSTAKSSIKKQMSKGNSSILTLSKPKETLLTNLSDEDKAKLEARAARFNNNPKIALPNTETTSFHLFCKNMLIRSK
jgi:hypothetical protein